MIKYVAPKEELYDNKTRNRTQLQIYKVAAFPTLLEGSVSLDN
jgi:hypothetical protein